MTWWKGAALNQTEAGATLTRKNRRRFTLKGPFLLIFTQFERNLKFAKPLSNRVTVFRIFYATIRGKKNNLEYTVNAKHFVFKISLNIFLCLIGLVSSFLCCCCCRRGHTTREAAVGCGHSEDSEQRRGLKQLIFGLVITQPLRFLKSR